MGLRKGQKELVEQYRGGYCAVPAIPGGGKTHCLSLWAVEMISNGLHKPGKILIVTYMNSAVNNFKQRIASELSKRGIQGGKDYCVSTIHSLCMQIIREKPDLILANEDFNIIDEVNKTHLVNACIEEWKRVNEERFTQYIDDGGYSTAKLANMSDSWRDKLAVVILGAIREFKSRGIDAYEAIKLCGQLGDDSLLKIASEVYDKYDKRLKMSGYLDFDDMLYNAKRMLIEDESLLSMYRKTYTFVCEDEAQDSNLIQNDILTMIANGNFLRVGDSNQAICGSFTSSDFRLFKDFCEKEDTVVYNITESSRNTAEIIDLANYFVKYVRDSHPVEECRNCLLPQFIETVGGDDDRKNPVTEEYGIKSRVFSSWEEEVEGVLIQARYHLKKHPDKTMAVLIPTSWKINYFVECLEARNMAY
ncbi:MAG TPA: ATP-dependent helicase, partial [Clostridia bacterium]